GARDPARLARARFGVGGADLGAGREAPGAVDDHAHPEAERFALGERADVLVLDLELLRPRLDRARFGVARALELGGVEGAIEDVVHARLRVGARPGPGRRLWTVGRADSVGRP